MVILSLTASGTTKLFPERLHHFTLSQEMLLDFYILYIHFKLYYFSFFYPIAIPVGVKWCLTGF